MPACLLCNNHRQQSGPQKNTLCTSPPPPTPPHQPKPILRQCICRCCRALRPLDQRPSCCCYWFLIHASTAGCAAAAGAAAACPAAPDLARLAGRPSCCCACLPASSSSSSWLWVSSNSSSLLLLLLPPRMSCRVVCRLRCLPDANTAPAHNNMAAWRSPNPLTHVARRNMCGQAAGMISGNLQISEQSAHCCGTGATTTTAATQLQQQLPQQLPSKAKPLAGTRHAAGRTCAVLAPVHALAYGALQLVVALLKAPEAATDQLVHGRCQLLCCVANLLAILATHDLQRGNKW